MEIKLEEVFNKEIEILKEHANKLEKGINEAEIELKGIKEQIANLELLKEAKIDFKDNELRPIAPINIVELIENEKKESV